MGIRSPSASFDSLRGSVSRIPRVVTIILTLATIAWGLSFGYLGAYSQDWLGLISLGAIGFISIGTLAYWAYLSRQSMSYQHKLKLIHAGISQLAPVIETAIFDAAGRTIWTTHPNTYPNQDEFLRKLLARIHPEDHAAQVKQMIEKRTKGEILIGGGGNGLGQDQKWWLFSTAPIDVPTYYGRGCFLAVSREVTSHLENYSQLRHSYGVLSNFIDIAPFGLLYVSSNGHITGINQTLSQWIGLEKGDIVGQKISQFFEDELTPHKKITILKSPRHGHSKVAILSSTDIDDGSKIRPIVLIRLEALAACHAGETFFEHTFSNAAIPALIVNEEGLITSFNTNFSTLVGDETNETNFFELIHPAMRSEVTTKVRRALENPLASTPFDIRFVNDKIHTTAFVSRITTGNQKPELLIQMIDSSEQKRLERQFIQSQKMQAVGQLAGGIAHDFNNLLTAMIGFSDLLLQRYLPNDPSYTDVMQIKQNANRASNLVRQLLAFSRQQTLQPKVAHITDSLAELSTLLRRLIGAGIELKMNHGRDLWPVKVDVSQLEQVIINLVVNARDAMNQGGVLTIRTTNFQSHKLQRVGHDVISQGDYVMVEVIDTGCGIPPEHLEHIFEPFFSTKEVGEGTGLGLSTVYGIVKQTGGVVLVESIVNRGTTFKILLPRHLGDAQKEITNVDFTNTDLTGAGTILLVEDEDAVRMFSARALREKGYQVIEAASGEMALEILDKGENIDLLVTDVVMPKMDGPTLSKRIRDRFPEIKTIFISGYTEDTFRKNLDHNVQIHFLPKPFTLKDLASKVKEVLTVKNQHITIEEETAHEYRN